MNNTQRNAVMDAIRAVEDNLRRAELELERRRAELELERYGEPFVEYISALKRTIAALKEGL